MFDKQETGGNKRVETSCQASSSSFHAKFLFSNSTLLQSPILYLIRGSRAFQFTRYLLCV